MKIFKVGFKSDYTYSVNMIWANTGKEEEEAVKETAERRAARYGYEVAFITEITESEAQSNINKGMPYYSIDEQAEADHDPSVSEDEPEPTAAEMVAEIAAKVEQTKTRSAWDKGVKAYALEMLEEMAFNAEHGYIDADVFSNRKTLRAALLNGAQDWSEYSYGGCSLIYDGDIAERLCNPSELKKTRNGERNPNSRETWLDVQARALGKASYLIIKTAGVPAFRGC